MVVFATVPVTVRHASLFCISAILLFAGWTTCEASVREAPGGRILPAETVKLDAPALIHDFLAPGALLQGKMLTWPGAFPDFAFRLLPDTVFESTRQLHYRVYGNDGHIHSGTRLVHDAYPHVDGVFTFRGGLQRDMPVAGTLSGTPKRITESWRFITRYDTTETRYGMWGGGMGWTGQPLLVRWPEELRRSFSRLDHDALHEKGVELIIGSLSGDVYFLDFADGKPVRPPIHTGNPIKGTPTLDPRMNGMLYVGDGVPHNDMFGIHMIDLYRHEPVYFFSGHEDRRAFRRWGAFDSSPALVGDYLYWPGENGILYRFFIDDGTVHLVTRLVYHVRGEQAAGIESSLAVYKNYGYFGDNHGNLLCVNLLTMKPVWYYDNHDDTDATIVIEVEDGVPYLYSATQVDRQGDRGYCRFVKLNGLDGSLVWENKIEAFRVEHYGRTFDGGMYATPLLGRKNAGGKLFSNIAHTDEDGKGEFIALDTSTGEFLFRTLLESYSWSSPVALYNEEGDLFVITADVTGNIYLIDGSDGRVIYRKRAGRNFEASPVVWGNSVIIGSRGREIFRFDIE